MQSKPHRRSSRFDANPGGRESFHGPGGRHPPDPKPPTLPPPSAPPTPPKKEYTARDASRRDNREHVRNESIAASIKKNSGNMVKNDSRPPPAKPPPILWGGSVFRSGGNGEIQIQTPDGVSLSELCRIKSAVLLVLKLLRDSELTVRLRGQGSVTDVPHMDAVTYRFIWKEVLSASSASTLQPFISAIKHAEQLAEFCNDPQNDNAMPAIKRIRTAESRPDGPPIEKAIQRDCQKLVRLDNGSRADLIQSFKKWADLNLSEYQKYKIHNIEKGLKRSIDPTLYDETMSQEALSSFLLDPVDGNFENSEIGDIWLQEMSLRFAAVYSKSQIQAPAKRESAAAALTTRTTKIEEVPLLKNKIKHEEPQQIVNNKNVPTARKRPAPRRAA